MSGRVRQHDDSRIADLRADEPKAVFVRPIGKEAPAAAEHHGENHQTVFVDQVVGHQGADERSAAGDQEWSAVACLQRGDLLGDLPVDEVTVLLVEVGQRC